MFIALYGSLLSLEEADVQKLQANSGSGLVRVFIKCKLAYVKKCAQRETRLLGPTPSEVPSSRKV